ncbi:galactan galactosyltransferase 1 [Thecamonas trahens ATCC 50062]|uniref:Alpha-galactosidase n=1 Tax=Thecamonas trahens ATCC 50062 TaxID=461836 RepID=A0A0L0DJS0_THETB|nr:galactan galactosyltransferase 1 [Thecamonas trahens ATCC 50062]KNC52547.1 galactan galactosyltransferase 1 [Thecamonas trahens ATCC 50062]|eukprot:XP_013755338.1 galactan galactosyltransferase 1 [Thecamonas trahens ATCC 50062]
MGWSTWCTDDPFCAFDTCDEVEVRSIADALVDSGLSKLGYTTILLDDCWADFNRTAEGKLQPLPKTFPSGIPALVRYLGDRGLGLGLYTDVGTTTCRKGRPGSYGHYETDAATFAEWGLSYVKIDNCARPGGKTEVELYSAFSAALNATGHPMYIGMCEWGDNHPEEWAPAIVQGYRVQQDHLPFAKFPPLAAGAGLGQGVVDVIEYMAYLQPSRHVAPYAWMDPDFLMTMYEPTMPRGVSRMEFSMWAMWSAPLITATDVRHMSHDKREILTNTEVLAIHSDPLWHAADLVANVSGGHVWARPLADGDIAVALLNFHDFLPRILKFDFAAVGWPAGQSAELRDLWAHASLGVHSTGYAHTVGPLDLLLVRMSKAQR